ncbi:MAG: pyridoxal-dependent decarboxylase [Verrucomicrobiota bacterium]
MTKDTNTLGNQRSLSSLFLGPKAENSDLMEKLLLDVLRDHAAWRRNFHPEDRVIIDARSQSDDAFQETQMRMRDVLFRMVADLKNSVPFFSPRYIGHMTSDTLMPGVLGYFAAMLYNPNNISAEASPTTTYHELHAGQNLCWLSGFICNEERERAVQAIYAGRDEAKSWGHITSGGTVANYESLWVARNLKLFPLAVRQALRMKCLPESTTVMVPTARGEKTLIEASVAELMNLPIDFSLELRSQCIERLRAAEVCAADEAARKFDDAVQAHNVGELGLNGFFSTISPELKGLNVEWPGVVIVPRSKHYSFLKLCDALGLGRNAIRFVALDGGYRTSVSALEKELDRCHEAGQPVLAVVAVCGSTEEGAIDPMREFADLRDKSLLRGQSFWLHCDAAWGGYLGTLCFNGARERSTGLLQATAGEVDDLLMQAGIDNPFTVRGDACQKSSATLWADRIYSAFEGTGRFDSVTIDPHKLGFVPYPAGAIAFRRKEVRDLITCHAPYVFHKEGADTAFIGRFILEGSKPGAAASAVLASQLVLGMDERGYGGLMASMCKGAQILSCKLSALSDDLGRFKIEPLYYPDSNLVCFVVNRAGNQSLTRMNRLTKSIWDRFSFPIKAPGQTTWNVGRHDYLISKTGLSYEEYGPADETEREANPVLGTLRRIGINLDTFGPHDSMDVLRMTVMDPWLLETQSAHQKQGTYLDGFIEALKMFLLEEYSVRASCSSLCRIRVNGKFLLVQNRKRLEAGDRVFGLIGGAFLLHDQAQADKLEINFEGSDEAGNSFLRFFLPKDRLRDLESWFHGGSGREKDPMRKVQDELCDQANIGLREAIAKSRTKRRGFVRKAGLSTRPGVVGSATEYFMEVWDIELPTDLHQVIESEAMRPDSLVRLVSEKEINAAITSSGERIAENAAWMLEADEATTVLD